METPIVSESDSRIKQDAPSQERSAHDEHSTILPLEMIDHIISFVEDSKKLLLRLSLVSRDWLFLAYPRQFRRLEVHVGGVSDLRDVRRKIRTPEELLEFLMDTPNVRRCVRELHLVYLLSSTEIAKQKLSTRGLAVGTLKAILSCLQLRVLYFSAPFDMDSVEALFPQMLDPADSQLELCELKVWFTNYPGLSSSAASNLALLLRLFRRVDHLTISSTNNSISSIDLPAVTMRVFVRKLNIWRVNTLSRKDILSCLSSTIASLALTSLTFSSHLSVPEPIYTFIQDTCREVTELTFNSYSWNSFPLSALSFLPKLTVLRIPINNTPDLDWQIWGNEWEVSMRFLAMDTSHLLLRELHISFRYTTDVIDQLTNLDWTLFGRALDANPHLVLVHIIILDHSPNRGVFEEEFSKALSTLLPARCRNLVTISVDGPASGFP